MDGIHTKLQLHVAVLAIMAGVHILQKCAHM